MTQPFVAEVPCERERLTERRAEECFLSSLRFTAHPRPSRAIMRTSGHDWCRIIIKDNRVVGRSFDKGNQGAIGQLHAELVIEIRADVAVFEECFGANQCHGHFRHMKAMGNRDADRLLGRCTIHVAHFHNHYALEKDGKAYA